MTGKLTARSAESLAKRKGRWLDGDGLFLRSLDPGSRSIGSTAFGSTASGPRDERRLLPGDDAGASAHSARRIAGAGPQGDRPGRRAAQGQAPPSPRATPQSFGAFSDAYLDRRGEARRTGQEPETPAAMAITLGKLPAWFRDLPVDEIGPQQVFDALDPDMGAQRPRPLAPSGRIEMVLDFARGPDDIRANPAAWSGWLKTQLGSKNSARSTARPASGSSAATMRRCPMPMSRRSWPSSERPRATRLWRWSF